MQGDADSKSGNLQTLLAKHPIGTRFTIEKLLEELLVNSEKILEWLDRSTFEIFLAGPISDEIPFPHKYGEHLPFNVFADSGIVYIADRPYIVSVMIQGKKGLPFEEEKEVASKFMQEVSDVVYKYFLEYKN